LPHTPASLQHSTREHLRADTASSKEALWCSEALWCFSRCSLLFLRRSPPACGQTSTDVYLAFIDSKESEIAAEEAARTEDVIATWSADSTKRDRARTVEIIRLSQQLDAEISTLEADVNDR
jgi:hypothetical protein